MTNPMKQIKPKYCRVIEYDQPKNELGQKIYDQFGGTRGAVYEYLGQKGGIGFFTDGIYTQIPIRMCNVIEIPESEVELVPYSLADLAKALKR